MREIKFRAWDKGLKRMIYLSEPTVENDDFSGIVFKLRDYFVSAFSSDRIEDLELMQYTGLRDKNGREVYEGDIVRFKDWWDEEMVGEVRYSEKDMAFTIVNDFWDGFPIMYADDLEVIGNIYENPELLEEVDEE